MFDKSEFYLQWLEERIFRCKGCIGGVEREQAYDFLETRKPLVSRLSNLFRDKIWTGESSLFFENIFMALLL